MLEKDMFEPVKFYLEIKGYKVYAEVGSADVVGVKENETIIIEMKKQLNFKVLEQIFSRIGTATKLYVAVPYNDKHPYGNPNHRFAYHILREYGIGLFFVKGDTIFEYIEGAEFDIVHDIRKWIREHNELTIGGSKSGDTVTEYSLTRERIQSFMKERDWVTVDDILKEVKTHWKNEKSSLAADLRAPYNKDWCEWKRVGRTTHYRYIIGSKNIDLRRNAREINSIINGKGGGSPDMIQGSCMAPAEDIEKIIINYAPET